VRHEAKSNAEDEDRMKKGLPPKGREVQGVTEGAREPADDYVDIQFIFHFPEEKSTRKFRYYSYLYRI
jgi:hypothetical protein